MPHAYRQFDPAGQLTDPGLRTALGELLGELAGAAIGLRTVVAGR